MTLSLYREAEGRIAWSLEDSWLFDAFWVVFLILVTRINIIPDLNTPSWAVADGLCLIAIIRNPAPFLATVNRNKWLLTWPLMATLSFFWSLTPVGSLYHGIQFIISLFVAFVFFQNMGVQRLVRIVFIYDLILQLGSASLLSGGIPQPGTFYGLYQHKNVLGMFSTLQILCALILFMTGWRRWLCVLSMAMGLGMLLISGSGTSIILTAVMLPLVFLVRTLQRGMHISFIIGGVLTAIIAAVGLSMTLSGHAEDPVNGILRLLGKDDTLTGRSVLWDFGMQSIEDHPILGIGYLAYWVSPATSSAYLTFVIDQQLEMFHNVFVEVTVALGFVGLFFFVTGLAQLIWRSLVYLVRQGTVMSCWPFLFTVWVTMLSMSENPIFGNTPFQFILTAGAAATFACDPRFTKRS